jgi:hypothetical protein
MSTRNTDKAIGRQVALRFNTNASYDAVLPGAWASTVPIHYPNGGRIPQHIEELQYSPYVASK